MSYAPYIKEIGRGPKGSKPLSVQQAESLFGDMMDGRVPDLELGAIILSMRIKAESTDELLGFQRALDARCARLAVPAGPRLVVLPTYNGARRQPNLMPLVAQLLARQGVPVLIQGRHDFDTRVSPFELLAALDIHPAGSLADAESRLASDRLAYRCNLVTVGADNTMLDFAGGHPDTDVATKVIEDLDATLPLPTRLLPSPDRQSVALIEQRQPGESFDDVAEPQGPTATTLQVEPSLDRRDHRIGDRLTGQFGKITRQSICPLALDAQRHRRQSTYSGG